MFAGVVIDVFGIGAVKDVVSYFFFFFLFRGYSLGIYLLFLLFFCEVAVRAINRRD